MKTATVRLSDILLTALAPMTWGTTYVIATELLPPNHHLLVAALRLSVGWQYQDTGGGINVELMLLVSNRS